MLSLAASTSRIVDKQLPFFLLRICRYTAAADGPRLDVRQLPDENEALVKSTSTDFSGVIPVEKLEISYCRSSGPGGQNVNKVSSKADVRFHVETADWIPASIKPLFLEKYRSRISRDGYFVVTSDRTRVSQMNLADCLDKIRSSLYLCAEELKPPPPLSAEKIAQLKERQEESLQQKIKWKEKISARKRGREM